MCVGHRHRDLHSMVTVYPALASGHSRKLRVTANPNVTLSRAHVPRHCQRARTVILGPLTQHELDAGSFLEYDGAPGSSRVRLGAVPCGDARGAAGNGANAVGPAGVTIQ